MKNSSSFFQPSVHWRKKPFDSAYLTFVNSRPLSSIDNPYDMAQVMQEKPAADDTSVEAVRTLLRSQNETHDTSLKTASLSFRHLGVTAPGDTVSPVKTLPRAILNTFGPDQFNFLATLFSKISGRVQAASDGGKAILTDFTGLVNPGEMLLVLGRPGSGCSTFLRTTANRSTLSVSGDLEYGDIPAATFARQHARETIYLPEEDQHIASLTVRETIAFALRTSLSQKMKSAATIQHLVQSIAGLFGLTHALDTSVGGSFFPGVSGGERKR